MLHGIVIRLGINLLLSLILPMVLQLLFLHLIYDHASCLQHYNNYVGATAAATTATTVNHCSSAHGLLAAYLATASRTCHALACVIILGNRFDRHPGRSIQKFILQYSSRLCPMLPKP